MIDITNTVRPLPRLAAEDPYLWIDAGKLVPPLLACCGDDNKFRSFLLVDCVTLCLLIFENCTRTLVLHSSSYTVLYQQQREINLFLLLLASFEENTQQQLHPSPLLSYREPNLHIRNHGRSPASQNKGIFVCVPDNGFAPNLTRSSQYR